MAGGEELLREDLETPGSGDVACSLFASLAPRSPDEREDGGGGVAAAGCGSGVPQKDSRPGAAGLGAGLALPLAALAAPERFFASVDAVAAEAAADRLLPARSVWEVAAGAAGGGEPAADANMSAMLRPCDCGFAEVPDLGRLTVPDEDAPMR
jgi:hypothetical protein